MKRLSLVLSLAACLAFAAPALAVNCPGPDLFGHECTNSDCSSLTPASWTTLGISGTDDSTQFRSLPFSFNYYGQSVSGVTVSANGFINMQANGDTFSFACPTPQADNRGNVGIYNDMTPFLSGTIRDGVAGTAPNRVYVVEYNNVQQSFNSSARGTYQIQLHENGGAGERVDIAVQSFNTSAQFQGMVNNQQTDALIIGCGQTPSGCTSMALPSGGGTGDCDLTPVLNAIAVVEAKLDMNLDVPVSSRSSQASVDALEVKLDTVQANLEGMAIQMCDVIRLLHTPQGQRDYAGSTLPDGTECGPFDWNFDNGGSGGE